MSQTVLNPNVRISPASKSTLRKLAEMERRPMQSVLDSAIEQYRRDAFFRELDERYARLQADPDAWREELDERRLWDSTASDGLEAQ